MRSPICLMSLLIGTSVPALAISLSGKIVDQSGAGKAGVVVSFQGATATTGTDGTWSIPDGSTGISQHLNGRQVTAGGHLLVDEGHLRVSLSGYDLMGRPRAGSAVAAMPTGTASGVSARTATAGVDTLLYSWNGKTFLRDTASVSRSGIVAIFDTIPNASIIYGWLTDTRDNQIYRTVKIGTQTWMAQNLNYKVDSSWCPDGVASTCSAYGRLYHWSSAMALSSHYDSTTWGGTLPHQGICPNGWNVPSDAEWSKLTDTTLNSATAGTVLKSTSDWNYSSNGTDAYGFSALPASEDAADGAFGYLGNDADFWSSSENDASSAWNRYFSFNHNKVTHDYDSKRSGFSLRCVQN